MVSCARCSNRMSGLQDQGRRLGEEVFGEQSLAEGDGFCKAEKGTGNV